VADVRITSSSQGPGSVAPAQSSTRAEAVKAAQRAFFNAALTQTQVQPEVRRAVAAMPSPAAQTTRLNATVIPNTPPTDRLLRPGSLLDIKV